MPQKRHAGRPNIALESQRTLPKGCEISNETKGWRFGSACFFMDFLFYPISIQEAREGFKRLAWLDVHIKRPAGCSVENYSII